MTTIATELMNELKKFNRGVQGVEIEYGIVVVQVSSKRAAYGVQLDMLRCRAFASVQVRPNAAAGRGYLVHGVAR